MRSMTINERFEKIINTLYKGNKRAFATDINVSPTVVENVVGKRQGKPSFDVIEKVCANANINIEWLITGKGEAFNHANKIGETPTTTHHQALQKTNVPHKGIPLIPVDAMAGFFQGEQSVMLSECDFYVIPIFKNADYLITVRGDSMQPKYYSGDIIACKHLSLSDIFFQWGKVYVIDTDQGALIKKVEQGNSNDTITLVSENPTYKPFEVARKSIYHISLVLGVIRAE